MQMLHLVVLHVDDNDKIVQITEGEIINILVQ
jgi:hypothetical protein